MKRLTIPLLLAALAVWSFDFRPYTMIDATMKSYLRSNWQAHSANLNSGVVHGLGNSITYTMAFWAPYQYGTNPGPVPGTDPASYPDKTCAYSGYRIDNGLACLNDALALKPEVVICEYGTNDMNDKSVGTFPTQYRDFIDQILATGCIPIITTIPPCRWGADSTYDPYVLEFNDTIRAIAAQKNVPCVDFWQAWMDYTAPRPWSRLWWGDNYVHPSGCDNAMMTDTIAPLCGYGIRNAVTWQAVNKVYRIIIDNGPADVVSVENSGNETGGLSISAWPNPFNPTVNISLNNYEFQITNYEFKIFNVLGKVVKDFGPEIRNSKFVIRNSFVWDASNQPSGVYIARVKAGNTTRSKILLLQK